MGIFKRYACCKYACINEACEENSYYLWYGLLLMFLPSFLSMPKE